MVETINTMVGGVTFADGQSRSLQLTESDDDNWTSKQTGGMPAWLPALITSFHFFFTLSQSTHPLVCCGNYGDGIPVWQFGVLEASEFLKLVLFLCRCSGVFKYNSSCNMPWCHGIAM